MKRNQQKQLATMLKQHATTLGFLWSNCLLPCECSVRIICIGQASFLREHHTFFIEEYKNDPLCSFLISSSFSFLFIPRIVQFSTYHVNALCLVFFNDCKCL